MALFCEDESAEVSAKYHVVLRWYLAHTNKYKKIYSIKKYILHILPVRQAFAFMHSPLKMQYVWSGRSLWAVWHFLSVCVCVLQRDGGEGAGQVPPPRLLRVLRLRHQPQAEGLLLCGGPAVLRGARSRSDENAGGTRPHHDLPLCIGRRHLQTHSRHTSVKKKKKPPVYFCFLFICTCVLVSVCVCVSVCGEIPLPLSPPNSQCVDLLREKEHLAGDTALRKAWKIFGFRMKPQSAPKIHSDLWRWPQFDLL